jgi:hypothetical protein
VLIQQGHIHEVTELHPGQLLQLSTTENRTGSPPAWAAACLVCRKP